MIKLWDDNVEEITDHPGMVELNPDTGGITFMTELNNENGRYKTGDGFNKIKKYEREAKEMREIEIKKLEDEITERQNKLYELRKV